MIRKGFVRALVMIASALALSGCAGATASGSTGPALTNQVLMPKSYRFDPATIAVTPGTTVTWRNDDNFTHSVKLRDGSVEDRLVQPGGTTQIRFDSPGEYDYICSLHPQNMRGKVIVQER
jgi:plastocyanin